MFDKLMVTKQVKMTHVPDRYHGQIFEILWGTALNRDTDEEEPLTRARMIMCHVCVSITSDKKNISKSQGICGEILACMSWECIRFQVDVIAGDGNKVCYLATPKVGGCPSYEVS